MNSSGPAGDSLDDTDAIDIAKATTVVDDSEQTEIDTNAVLEDIEQTQNGNGRKNGNGAAPEAFAPSAVKGAFPMKTVCIILAALSALLAIVIGLVRLP